jgi:serine/threonine protein kinase
MEPLPECLEESIDSMERRFEAQYEILEPRPLGEGTYGKVYKARSRKTTGPYEVVAMKKMKLDSEDEGVPSTAIREVALLKELSHENVVKLLDVFCSTNRLTLVFEFAENDLKKYMKAVGSTRGLRPEVVKSFSLQLVRGIEFCHANRVLHRDLKPQNLLITCQLRLKVADFGLARAYSVPVPKLTHEVVTVWYRPPEILLGSVLYSVPVDIWSIGCIVGEMATGAPLFAGDSEIDTIFKVFQKLGTPTEEQWPGLNSLPDWKLTFPKWPRKGWANIRNTASQVGQAGVDLLTELTHYDPKQRISARRALQHPYFQDTTAS